jgi:tRNA nucleotidyltransferase (CCA-adding enzyme)
MFLTSQDLVPILSTILAAPLGTAYLPLLSEAAHSMEVLALNNWARIAPYRGEYYRGLGICWIHLDDGEILRDLEGQEQVRIAVKDALRALKAAIKSEADFESEWRVLRENDQRLEALLVL